MTAWRVLGSCLVVALVVCAPGYARAQQQAGVGVVTTLVGEATVTRAALAHDQALKKRDDVYPQDRISTKERSLVHVLMGGKALLTVRELSVLTVTEEGGRATVDLQSGKVGLAVVRERMRPGEVIEVHTPHAVAAVRGTVLVVEIVPGSATGDQIGAGGTSTNVHLLHGKLDVSLRSDPAAPPVKLESLQTVSVSSKVLGPIRPLSPAAVASVTASLRPGQPAQTALPEKFQSALGEQQRVLAIENLDGLAVGGLVRKGQGAQARVDTSSKLLASGLERDSVEVVSDAGDGVGAVVGSVLGGGSSGGSREGKDGGSDGGGGSDNGGRSGSGRGTGIVSGKGGGNVQTAGSGAASVGGTLAPIVPTLHKKGK